MIVPARFVVGASTAWEAPVAGLLPMLAAIVLMLMLGGRVYARAY
jgi:hypothetical protein